MTWQKHLKEFARDWREMKLVKKNAEKAKNRKSAPPAVPRRVRGKKVDPERDIN